MGQLRASEDVGNEGRSRKPRVTLERKDNLECNSRGDGGLYSWQSGEGARYPIRWDASRFGSDEMSPLYENAVSVGFSSNATAPITGRMLTMGAMFDGPSGPGRG